MPTRKPTFSVLVMALVKVGMAKMRWKMDTPKVPVSHKTIHQQNGQRVEDKQSQKRDQHDDGGHH